MAKNDYIFLRVKENFLTGYASAMLWEHSQHKASRFFALLISFCYFWSINIFLWIPAITNVINTKYSFFGNQMTLHSHNYHSLLILLILFCVLPPFQWKILGHNIGILLRLWRKISAPLSNKTEQIADEERLKYLYEYFTPNNSGIFSISKTFYLGVVWWGNFLCIIITIVAFFNSDEKMLALGAFVFLIFSLLVANSVYRYGIEGGKMRKIFFAISHIPLFALIGMIIALYMYLT